GRVERGSERVNQEVAVTQYPHEEGEEITSYRGKVVSLYQIEGLSRVPAETATVGDIVCIAGLEKINIGETICAVNCVEPLPFVKISEPTVEMTFSVNDSPFTGN